MQIIIPGFTIEIQLQEVPDDSPRQDPSAESQELARLNALLHDALKREEHHRTMSALDCGELSQARKRISGLEGIKDRLEKRIDELQQDVEKSRRAAERVGAHVLHLRDCNLVLSQRVNDLEAALQRAHNDNKPEVKA